MASNSDIFRSSISSIASSENLLDNLSSEYLVDESSAVVMDEEELKKENQALKQKINKLELKKAGQDRPLDRVERTLGLFEKEKNGLVDKLYSKFLPDLKAKKEEILRLQTLLALKAKAEEDDKIKRQKL